MVITPSAMVRAPVMHPLTHNGVLQCRHETAKLIPSFSSMRILGFIFMPFNARAISPLVIPLSLVPAKAQKYSHKWHPRHHFSFT
jgi:hypothetical protein